MTTPTPPESRWAELRREIEALPVVYPTGDSDNPDVSQAAVLALIDRLEDDGLDVERLAKALAKLGPGTVEDLAWSHSKWEWSDENGHWTVVEDDTDSPVDDDYPMASLARAVLDVLSATRSTDGADIR